MTGTSFPELLGAAGAAIPAASLDSFVGGHLEALPLDGKDVVLVIPDRTRSCPLSVIVPLFHRHLVGRVARLTAVIALGTHPYMGPDEIADMLGGAPAQLLPGMEVLNHEWKDPGMLAEVGRIPAERIGELSEGRLAIEAPIRINRRVAEADVAIVVGPVFPHEVVGMSGGNKYFIPGVSGHEFIDMTHWVGALITSSTIIGTTGTTPVRAMIDEGAALIPAQRMALCLVVESGTNEVEAAAFGTPERAWELAAGVAAASHVHYVDEPFTRVLACMPPRYTEIWTAAKGFYKTEPAMADGGEVIIYAPHIGELSEVHREIYDIGYHCRDYFVKQWDRFERVPWGVLAHSTHLRGQGTYDAASGTESLRVKVTLATQIPREVCEAVNLGYLDPREIDPAEWRASGRATVIENAGEVLFRLRG